MIRKPTCYLREIRVAKRNLEGEKSQRGVRYISALRLMVFYLGFTVELLDSILRRALVGLLFIFFLIA
jgi:uncharacterized membrane protein